jgi:hypothetical protein
MSVEPKNNIVLARAGPGSGQLRRFEQVVGTSGGPLTAVLAWLEDLFRAISRSQASFDHLVGVGEWSEPQRDILRCSSFRENLPPT